MDWLSAKQKANNLTPRDGNVTFTDFVKDGVTFVELVEALGELPMAKYKKNAVLPVHKIDNMNTMLNYMKDKLNAPVNGVSAEDLINGEPKKIMLYISVLQKKFV